MILVFSCIFFWKRILLLSRVFHYFLNVVVTMYDANSNSEKSNSEISNYDISNSENLIFILFYNLIYVLWEVTLKTGSCWVTGVGASGIMLGSMVQYLGSASLRYLRSVSNHFSNLNTWTNISSCYQRCRYYTVYLFLW